MGFLALLLCLEATLNGAATERFLPLLACLAVGTLACLAAGTAAAATDERYSRRGDDNRVSLWLLRMALSDIAMTFRGNVVRRLDRTDVVFWAALAAVDITKAQMCSGLDRTSV